MHLRATPLIILGITAVTAFACGGHTVVFGQSGDMGGGSTLSSSGGGATGTGGSVSHGGSVTASSSGTTTTSSSTSSSSTSTTSGTAYPAAFPAPPQVVTGGGPVLASPQIYPVFFSNDDAANVAALTGFTMGIGSTPYWKAATSEYGVGPATGHAPIMLSQAAPATIDDSAIQTWLATEFDGTDGFPTPDANTLILLYYPSSSTITLQGATSCQTFGGYHNSATVGNQQVAYAVVPNCSGISTTGAASHELVEAATDPNPEVNPAYVQVDEGDFYWQLILGGGEVGDMCAQFPNVFTTFPPFNYTVQRIWSNKSANAGHDPCVPELPGEVYFNAAPVLPGVLPWTIQGQTAMIKAVSIPVGGTMTIPVQLFSEGPTPAWTVTAVDPAVMLGAPSALLDLTLDKSTGQNGDVLQLTINVLGAGSGNAEVFIVKSSNATTHYDWFGAVISN
jgi:hypothetical protein